MRIDIVRLILLAALALLSFGVQPAQSQTTNSPPAAPQNLWLKIFPNVDLPKLPRKLDTNYAAPTGFFIVLNSFSNTLRNGEGGGELNKSLRQGS